MVCGHGLLPVGLRPHTARLRRAQPVLGRVCSLLVQRPLVNRQKRRRRPRERLVYLRLGHSSTASRGHHHAQRTEDVHIGSVPRYRHLGQSSRWNLRGAQLPLASILDRNDSAAVHELDPLRIRTWTAWTVAMGLRINPDSSSQLHDLRRSGKLPLLSRKLGGRSCDHQC